MPVENCTENGKSGVRWGKHGKCYTHDGSKPSKEAAIKKMNKQRMAIEISKHSKGYEVDFKECDGITLQEFEEAIEESGVKFTQDDLQQISLKFILAKYN